MQPVLPKKSNALGWMVLPYKRYAQFEGRSGRREFWWYCLGLTLSYIAAALLGLLILGLLSRTPNLAEGGDAVGAVAALSISIPILLVFAANFVPAMALTSRRLHDIGLPGWLSVVAFFCVILLSGLAWIAYMVVMSLPPKSGENEYGPPVYDDDLGSIFS
ncbi:MAG: DUF805 domain-containing protein [Pontixanthobacter sp.]